MKNKDISAVTVLLFVGLCAGIYNVIQNPCHTWSWICLFAVVIGLLCSILEDYEESRIEE